MEADYTDDVAQLENSPALAEFLLHNLEQPEGGFSLHVNANKTKYVRLIKFFGAYLLHLLIMWLILSSLSPHNLHLLFCFDFIYLNASVGISTFLNLFRSTFIKVFVWSICILDSISIYRSNSVKRFIRYFRNIVFINSFSENFFLKSYNLISKLSMLSFFFICLDDLFQKIILLLANCIDSKFPVHGEGMKKPQP